MHGRRVHISGCQSWNGIRNCTAGSETGPPPGFETVESGIRNIGEPWEQDPKLGRMGFEKWASGIQNSVSVDVEIGERERARECNRVAKR